MNYVILCTRGPMKGRRWGITPQGLKMGRDGSCEIQVKDLSAELFHCIVKLADGRPVVLNLASTKGVEVNGAYVGEATLKPADSISIGNEKFELVATDGGKGGSRSKVLIAPIVVMLIAIVAIGVTFFMRTKSAKRPVAVEPQTVPAKTLATKETPADDAVTTNRVVRIVNEEVITTNRIVRIVDNIMVTNFVVEIRRNGELVSSTALPEQTEQGKLVAKQEPQQVPSDSEPGNGYVPPEPTEGLKFSEDGKTLVFVPHGIAHVVIPNGVTTIGDSAFADHKALESVTIPPSVTKFGRNAFVGCDRLVGVFITDLAAWCQISFEYDNKPFDMSDDNPLCYAHNLYLDGLLVRDMEIPQGVTSVGNNAFRGCWRLTSVKIPDCVRLIGPGAFAASRGDLAKFEVDAANRYYKSVNGLLLTKDGRTLVAVPVGLDNITIPAGVVSIGDRAFAGCSKLTKLTIPDGVTSIGYKAFHNCSGLASIKIPSTLTKIDHGAFNRCDNLADVYISDVAAWCSVDRKWDESIDRKWSMHHNDALVSELTIPDGVTRIKQHVFRGCDSLTRITIPRSVERIEGNPFVNCPNLMWIEVANGNRHFKSDGGILVTKDGKKLVAVPCGLEKVRIPNGVESIGVDAANRCEKIIDLIIPNGVAVIDSYAFAACKRLSTVQLPKSLREIRRSAFNGCGKIENVSMPTGLELIREEAFRQTCVTNITIPGSVESVGQGAFLWVGSLKNVTIQEGVKDIGPWAFEGTGIKSIVIPQSTRRIASAVFKNCKRLESVTIPEGLTNIHENAFEGCKRLLDATGKPRLTRVPSTANKGATGRAAK